MKRIDNAYRHGNGGISQKAALLISDLDRLREYRRTRRSRIGLGEGPLKRIRRLAWHLGIIDLTRAPTGASTSKSGGTPGRWKAGDAVRGR